MCDFIGKLSANGTRVEIRKLVKSFASRSQYKHLWKSSIMRYRRDNTTQRVTEDHLHQKCQIWDYQNKNRLSGRRLVMLQRKPILGRTKPSIGPHAAIVEPKLESQQIDFCGGVTLKRAYFHAFMTNGQIDCTFVGPQKIRWP